MIRDHANIDSLSELLRYLSLDSDLNEGIPTLSVLSRELGVSISSLREQLEVARALGLVDVRPRTGIKRLPYTFAPSVRQSLGYAIRIDNTYFHKFSELRNHIESAYWHEAVALLTLDDKQELIELVAQAEEKLKGDPIQIPHDEHRQLHTLIFKRLENPFVTGLLEAYWDAYEAVGLNVFTGGLNYLHKVWDYHSQMIEAICKNEFDTGFTALIQHTDLLYHKPEDA